MESLLQSISFVLLFACLGTLTHAIANHFHFFTTPLSPRFSLPLYHLLSAFGIYIISQMIISHIILYVTAFFIWENTIALIAVSFFITSIITLIFLLAYGYFQKRLPFRKLWKSDHSRSSLIHDLLLGVVMFIISFPVISFFNKLIELTLTLILGEIQYTQSAVYFFKWASSNPLSTIFAFLIITIIGPLIEELLYRGFLQTYLRTKFNAYTSIFITSILFSFAHFSPLQSYGNIVIISSIFIFSLYLGYLYEKTGSLYSNISLHVTFNFISVIRMLIE